MAVLLAVAAAWAAQRAAALQVAPTSAPTSGAPTNGTEVLAASRKRALTWILAATGQSCTSACGDGTCSESELAGLDSEAEMEAAAVAAGNPCDSSLPKGYTEYPVIDEVDDSCAFKRAGGAPDACAASDAARFGICYCDGIGTQWYLSALGQTCTARCVELGGTCNPSQMEALNSKTAVTDIADSLGQPCDQSLLFFAFDYPSVTAGGQCTYYFSNAAVATCSVIHDQCAGRRLCPCDDMTNPGPGAGPGAGPDPSAQGDPHLTNMLGEKFDFNRAGLATFLLFPRSVPDGEAARLRVDAQITHPKGGNPCRGFFITKVWISGSMVGDEIELGAHGIRPDTANAFLIQIGKKVMNDSTDIAQALITKPYKMKWYDERRKTGVGHIHNRVRFAKLSIQFGNATLVVDWLTGKKRPNSMNVAATKLKMIGTDWGGLLGGDDHFWVTQFDSECKEGTSYSKVPQLLQEDRDVEWTATASLS